VCGREAASVTLHPSQVIAPKWKPDDGALHTLHDIDLKSTLSFLSSSQPVHNAHHSRTATMQHWSQYFSTYWDTTIAQYQQCFLACWASLQRTFTQFIHVVYSCWRSHQNLLSTLIRGHLEAAKTCLHSRPRLEAY